MVNSLRSGGTSARWPHARARLVVGSTDHHPHVIRIRPRLKRKQSHVHR